MSARFLQTKANKLTDAGAERQAILGFGLASLRDLKALLPKFKTDES
ncbi:MAG TPA: hypothetical protein VIW80_07845 [Pyrinomonadaceae bacterium]|jgi:hypothetical protein